MKTYLLAILCLFAVTFNANAQLADGSVAPNFTVTDLEGTTYSLYDLLDAGYTVVIDLNATWCAPCWSYHTAGHLETLWEEHGPAGMPGVSPNTTNDVFVMMIESDNTTGLDDLNGATVSTQGDWVTGTLFPIVDDASVGDAYNLNYYPTIFTICRNRLLNESGQLSAADHYANINSCPEPIEGTNATLLAINTEIDPVGCATTANGNLSVTVQNMGTNPLTDFTVEVFANGQSIASESYSGSLDMYATTEIDFGNLTIDTESIQIEITSTDDNAADNVMTQDFQFSTGETEQTVTVNLLTDDYSNETYIQITDENGEVVWSEGNENIAGNYNTGSTNVPGDPTNPLQNNQSYSWEVSLPALGCYTFLIGDYYGDGLFASQWGGTDGDWSIENNTGVVIGEYLNFTATDDVSFQNNDVADPTSITEAEALDIAVYPNPVSSNATLSLNLTESADVKLDVTNILGEVVISELHSMNSGNNLIKLNVDELTNGVYFAHLTINGDVSTLKITVSK